MLEITMCNIFLVQLFDCTEQCAFHDLFINIYVHVFRRINCKMCFNLHVYLHACIFVY